jgi:nucleotide-binding universal stress UspA family protein
MSFQKIIIAIDHGETCQSIFNHGLELAKQNQSVLMLFHSISSEFFEEMIVPLPVQGLYPEVVAPMYDLKNMQLEKRIEETINLLQNYTHKATDVGITTEFDYKVGDAGKWLCKTAKNWEADLIIMGRRGRKGLTEVMLGSVSNYVLHNAPCSVLVIQTH